MAEPGPFYLRPGKIQQARDEAIYCAAARAGLDEIIDTILYHLRLSLRHHTLSFIQLSYVVERRVSILW